MNPIEPVVDDAPTSVDGGLTPEAIARRSALKKLAVGGVVAWSTPVIYATAAAAAKASKCKANTVPVYGPAGTKFGAGRATTGGSSAVTVSLSTSTLGMAPDTRANVNENIVLGTVGGFPNSSGVVLEQNPTGNRGQRVTFSFSERVFDVSFIITDLDNLNGEFGDRLSNFTRTVTGNPAVSPAPPPAAFSKPTTASEFIGLGTPTDPIRTEIDANLNDSTSFRGNVRVTFTGAVNSFSFDYLNGSNNVPNGTPGGAGSDYQHIYLIGLTFCG